ncbi:MAG: M15 family metallopeptidase [Eggerthellaceae bacterium]|nr:M15 family metallopeptidase [Eggerthellaceae bacterium]
MRIRGMLVAAAALALTAALVGCGGTAGSAVSSSAGASSQPAQASSATAQSQGIDYLALVNKLNPLPEGWEDALETVHFTNSVGDDVEVEKKAYDAYLELKADLEKEGVHVDLDSARRSVADQQRIMDEFTKEYGADYAKKTVAQPGYSEHHTGLALDLYLVVDGKDVVENEDMMGYPEIWAKIHAKLAEHGFILRYLDGDEHITGYGYEPWHIRYLDDVAIAKDIMEQGITFEEYKAGKVLPEVSYDYGDSKRYTRAELTEAAIQVKCDFAAWEGCELHSLRYAGDECDTQENVDWLNSIDKGAGYTHVAEFLTDFHSPLTEKKPSAWNLDTEYTDYQWWLGRTEDGSWQVVTSGY